MKQGSKCAEQCINRIAGVGKIPDLPAQGEDMKKKRKTRSLKPLIVLLLIALAAVCAVIAWKQHEYGVSEEFYGGLRGSLELFWRRV